MLRRCAGATGVDTCRNGLKAFWRVCVLGVLAPLLLSSVGCAARDLDSLQTAAAVLHYDVALDVDVDDLSVSGRARLIVVPHERGPVRLLLDGPAVSDVSVEGIPARFDHRRGVLSVFVDAPSDTLSIEIAYGGRPATGLYAGAVDGRRVVFTDGWPMRVSGWLPGVHHPSQPATLEIEVTANRGRVVASGREVSESDERTRWVLDAPAPTYAFAFAIAEFERTEVGEAVHYHFGRHGGFERSDAIISVLESMFGPYPYRSFATVAVPFDFAGMENASTAFLNARLYADPEALEEVLIHEIVHQWFGNSITIAAWQDLWISEGITTYLTTVVRERLDGLDAGRLALADMADVSGDRTLSSQRVRPQRLSRPEDALTWATYRKGGSMLHALRLKIGDVAFFEALRDLYDSKAPGPASTHDAIGTFSAAAGRDLSDFFRFWLDRRGVPALSVTWDQNAEMLSWRVSGDDGTLDDVDFEIEIGVDGELWYVNRSEGLVAVPGAGPAPVVRPVGVMLDVRMDDR